MDVNQGRSINNSGTIVLIFLGSLFCSQLSFGQSDYLENPSLEGTRETSVSPPNWRPCASNSTPDTQPGSWEVARTPSDGHSYVSMIVRGDYGPNKFTTEDIGTLLKQPLLANQCYLFQADLALSGSFGHTYDFTQWLGYDAATVLNVYGGTATCQKAELLWRSDPVENHTWLTNTAVLIPSESYTHLILEADYDTLPEYNGNILVDNLVLESFTAPKMKMDTTVKYGQTIHFSASEGEQYSWVPTAGLSCSTCQNPELLVENSELYMVEILDATGCTRIEEFRIFVALDIPGLITPNGDGDRDGFVIRGMRDNSVLDIYDRTGRLLFHSDNYQNNWYGESTGGSPLAAGVYYYRFSNRELNVSRSSSFVLIRGQ